MPGDSLGTLPIAGVHLLVAAPARLCSTRRFRNCVSVRSDLRRPRCSFAIAYLSCQLVTFPLTSTVPCAPYPLVPAFLCLVMGAVDLHHEPQEGTIEVHDPPRDDVLSSELHAFDLPVSQAGPQARFSQRWVTPHLPGLMELRSRGRPRETAPLVSSSSLHAVSSDTRSESCAYFRSPLACPVNDRHPPIANSFVGTLPPWRGKGRGWGPYRDCKSLPVAWQGMGALPGLQVTPSGVAGDGGLAGTARDGLRIAALRESGAPPEQGDPPAIEVRLR